MADKLQLPAESNPPVSQNNNGVYEIKIKGYLDDHWKSWFEGMTLGHEGSNETGQEFTLITGHIVDQPALHGLLAKIRDLNLTLISVRKLDPKEPSNQQGSQKDADAESSGQEQL